MAGGVIKTKSATGDVHFVGEDGTEIKDAARGVRVEFEESFAGMTIDEAVAEASKFAVGALQIKLEAQTRGIDCRLVVKNLKVRYRTVYGFKK